MKLAFSFLLFIFILARPFAADAQSIQSIKGEWKEHWGVGSENDIGYSDVFTIQVQQPKISITCPERANYKFRKIHFVEGVLSFELLNTHQNDILPYSLTISEDKKMMKGHAKNIYGEVVDIEWEKLD